MTDLEFSYFHGRRYSDTIMHIKISYLGINPRLTSALRWEKACQASPSISFQTLMDKVAQSLDQGVDGAEVKTKLEGYSSFIDNLALFHDHGYYCP